MRIVFQVSYHRRQQRNPVNAIKTYELQVIISMVINSNNQVNEAEADSH